MVSIAGVAGTKTFWMGTDWYRYTGGQQCQGCGSWLMTKLVLRTIYETDKNAMVWGRGCGLGRSELQSGGRIGSDGSGLLGIQEALDIRGIEDKNLIVMSGDGRTLEMGGGDFLATFDRNQKLTYIVADNNIYADSRSQAGPTTPLGAETRINTRESGGKPTTERQMPLAMLFMKTHYVATASVAYVRDLVVKVQEAMRYKPSYLQVSAPCQVSWGYEPQEGVKLTRLMVQTGLVPLWSFKEGVFKRTVRIPEEAQVSVEEFLEPQRRFRDITPETIQEMKEYIVRKNALVDAMELALNKPGITVSY